ncbi:response regulator [Polyangium sp. y55x31]|uniref:response regulator n=1 Tax=Polyangium sp. y55x31 TaxID=3042688 RepID=UPI00248328F4|nr:response regulator [Polyangium sp. y55x31]MDI1475071.1 response regulator [Polyangium sp. y55x31]
MKTILLVDDELAIVDTVAEVLAWEGYRVVTAPNGKEGLALVASERPDLALVDFMMPVMDGVQMLRALRADPAYATLPVVLITAAPRALPADVRASTPVLAKPFDVQSLLRVIRGQIDP